MNRPVAFVLRLTCTFASLLVCTPAGAGSDSLLEFTVGEKTYQGKAVVHDDNHVWLMGRGGQLNKLTLDRVKSFRKVSAQFRRYSSAELRNQLRREFSHDFDVVGTAHYLVCGPKEQAQQYAKVFEDIYRTCYTFFSARSFKLKQAEFPLVGIVFPDRAAFARYAAKDGISAGASLLGYYLISSNRVALFDRGTRSAGIGSSRPTRIVLADTGLPFSASHSSGSVMRWDGSLTDWCDSYCLIGRTGSINSGLKDTIVHETTHQVAFNIGLHSRIGTNPRWVVEGLATVFEAPGIRDRGPKLKIENRLNRERYLRFGNYAKKRRKPGSLESFIVSDSPFQRATLDAYSQAWALTFFLIETRSSAYSTYLKAIAARDPLKPHGEQDRLADFKLAFGDNLPRLEAAFLRFISGLK